MRDSSEGVSEIGFYVAEEEISGNQDGGELPQGP